VGADLLLKKGGGAESLTRDYKLSARIGMMRTNRSDYLRTRRAKVAVNYSNSLDFQSVEWL